MVKPEEKTEEPKHQAVNLGEFLVQLKAEGKLTINDKGWLVINQRDAAKLVMGMLSDKIEASPNENEGKGL